jgi:plastocyanin
MLAACDNGPSYGSNALTNFTPKPIPTLSPTPSPIKPNPITVQSSPAHTQPPPQTTRPAPTHAQQVVQVLIGAEGPTYMDPPQVIIPAGSIVRWTNNDSVDSPRIIKADNGAFTSPPIPPGGSWQMTFASSGDFQYHDQRPYAGGDVQVR